MEEIKDIIEKALDNEDYDFIAMALGYIDNNYLYEQICDWLAHEKELCPDCLSELTVLENDDRPDEYPLVQTFLFYECDNCGWGK